MHLKSALAILTAAAVTSVFAEYETLNVFGSIGPGFGIGGRHYQSTEVTDNNTTVTDRFFNYGSGLKFDVGCQYFMMENVALQASFGYSAGFPFKQEIITDVSTLTTTFGRHVFGVKVQVVPRFEFLDLINMYTGVGIGFFWNSRPFKTVSETGIGGTRITQEATGKITSKPTFGLLGQFGADFPLNDNLTLFGELGFEQLRFNLSKFKVKESSIPGITNDTYLENDSDNMDPEKVPGSNFQIRVGVRYAIMR